MREINVGVRIEILIVHIKINTYMSSQGNLIITEGNHKLETLLKAVLFCNIQSCIYDYRSDNLPTVQKGFLQVDFSATGLGRSTTVNKWELADRREYSTLTCLMHGACDSDVPINHHIWQTKRSFRFVLIGISPLMCQMQFF